MREAWCLLRYGRVPSIDHEAPLAVLREEPALVPALLREALGVEVPPFATVDVGDAGFTQAVPAEARADLVVHLRGGPPDHAVVMGVVVEIQRARDDGKRRSWPLYVAALHARLRCPTSLVVIATDDATARWAATPITTLQMASPFTPLVIGPDRIPRVSRARAVQDPWMAVLSAVVHGNRTGGDASTLAAFDAMQVLPRDQAVLCYSLIRGSWNEVARHTLEDKMLPEQYTPEVSEMARRALDRMEADERLRVRALAEGHAEGLAKGLAKGLAEGQVEGRVEGARAALLAVADRYGAVSDELRARVGACADPERLRALVLDVANAADRAAVEQVLGRLPAAPG